MNDVSTDLATALRTELTRSMRARDSVASAALRAALADLANAESIPIEHRGATPQGDQHFAGSSVGLGAAEAPRRFVGAEESRALVELEVVARRSAAVHLRAKGRKAEAAASEHGADVLEAVLRSLAT